MKPVLVFDVNETLLSVHALQPSFERIFGEPGALKEWFSAVLLYSQTLTILGEYKGFSELAQDALHMLSSAKKIPLPANAGREILEGMLSLPAHPDVTDGLNTLRTAGFRLSALTNSTQTAAESQLKNAGLRGFFERVLSVEAVGRFKPALEVYTYAASELNVLSGQMLMIASHPWDIKGAMHAGLHGAFLNRAGTAWFGTDVAPQFRAPDLRQLAQALIAAY